MICWGATSDECEATSLELIGRAEQFLATRGRAEPFGAVRDVDRTAPRRRARVGGGAARARRPRASLDRPAGRRALLRRARSSSSSSPRARRRALAALGTSCPDHFLRTKVRPLFLDLGPGAPFEDAGRAAARAARAVPRAEYAAYYERHATHDTPPMRGSDPVDRAGARRRACGASASTRTTARVAGEFFVNAINVMRGAESVSSYTPIPDAEKFRVEYWELEERKLRRRPAPARSPGGWRWSPAGRRASGARSPNGSPPRARASSSPTSTARAPRRSPPTIGDGARAGGRGRRDRRGRGRRGVRRRRAPVRRRRPRRQQRRASPVSRRWSTPRSTTGTASTRCWHAVRSS